VPRGLQGEPGQPEGNLGESRQHILVDIKCRNRDEAVKRATGNPCRRHFGQGDFTAYAKRFSDDPSKEKNGGDLGLVQQSVFDEQFRKQRSRR
jgi:parvulin-like peptidyl-prolyl isomerase